MEPNIETFEHQCSDEHKIFPIDYTRDELAQCMDYQPSNSEITKKILSHPFFANILSQLRFRPGPIQKSGTLPIPLETVPLLKCFYDIAVRDEYQGEILKNQALTNSSTAKNIRDSFVRELCLTLCKEIAPSQPEENAYYRHVVFSNESFKRILMDDLFKRELEPRIDTIQELVKSLDTNTQITALQNCLLILDRTILDLKQMLASVEHKDDPVPYEEIPSQLLEELLKKRKQAPNKTGNAYATYEVRNTRLDNGLYMKDVFSVHEIEKDTLIQARKAYLSDLATQDGAGAFEEDYFKTQNYLRLTSFSGSLEERRSFIFEQCKKSCARLIQFCTYEPTAALSLNSHLFYDTTLIDQLVQFYMSHFLMSLGSTLQILCCHSAQYYSLPEKYRHNSNPFSSDPTPTKDGRISDSFTYVVQISSCLQDEWQSFFEGEIPIFDTSILRFVDPSNSAEILWQESQISKEFFDCELPIMSKDEIEQELIFLNKVLDNRYYDFFPPQIIRAFYKLQMLVFLRQLQVLALGATEWMIHYTDPIHDLMTDYHPPKADR